MSTRHELAISAVQTHNLLELCTCLSGAVQDAINEGQMPHMDPAIRLITHHIAYAGNGDLPFLPYYQKIYDYCLSEAQHGPNTTFLQTEMQNVEPKAN